MVVVVVVVVVVGVGDVVEDPFGRRRVVGKGRVQSLGYKLHMSYAPFSSEI